MAGNSFNWDAPERLVKNYVKDGNEWVPMTQASGSGEVTGSVEVTNTSLDVHNYVWDVDTLAWVVQVEADDVAHQVNISLTETENRLGATNETAPVSDTATAALNGRLQRVAQRLTTINTTLGSPFQAGGSIGNTTFASTQSGTWTVQPGNTANTTAWKVDGSAVTQPVSDASGSLTVDAPVGTPVFVRLSDGSSAVSPALDASVTALKVTLSVAAIQATASGDTTLISSGTRKLRRIEASNSHASTALTIGIKVPSINSGNAFGKKYLPAAGGQAVWNFPMGYLTVTSEAVSVNLSTSGQIEVTAFYE